MWLCLFVLLQVLLSLGDYMNVQCHACIGGKSIGEDIRRLDYGVQVRYGEGKKSMVEAGGWTRRGGLKAGRYLEIVSFGALFWV